MKELLKILKQFGIYSEYLKILDVEIDGDRYITILTPTTLNWIEEEEIEETLEEIFKNVRVKISRLPLI
jgi:predicted acylesterase/phospholipase RssA